MFSKFLKTRKEETVLDHECAYILVLFTLFSAKFKGSFVVRMLLTGIK